MSLPIARLKLQNSPVIQGNRYKKKLGMGMMLSVLADRKLKYLVVLKSICPGRNCEDVKFTWSSKGWVA
jgi:hypothetical protein